MISRYTALMPLLMACSLGTGCRLFEAAWQTSVVEPLHFTRCRYERQSRGWFTDLAMEAFEQARMDARAQLDNYTCEPYSADFQAGFLDGFVDYLEAGAIGDPHPLLPRKYWKAKFQNPAGHQAMDDWVRGFQYGAERAEASNYRSFVVVPIGEVVTTDTLPYPYGRLSHGQAEVIDGAAEFPGAEQPDGRQPDSSRQPGSEVPGMPSDESDDETDIAQPGTTTLR
ncbi:MAG: hypothetical protein KDA60_13435 [Planctomycetales bacterium]|nr:hypothetical protein [Planctomycetales bacterium]